jgi:hypothetical protein
MSGPSSSSHHTRSHHHFPVQFPSFPLRFPSNCETAAINAPPPLLGESSPGTASPALPGSNKRAATLPNLSTHPRRPPRLFSPAPNILDRPPLSRARQCRYAHLSDAAQSLATIRMGSSRPCLASGQSRSSFSTRELHHSRTPASPHTRLPPFNLVAGRTQRLHLPKRHTVSLLAAPSRSFCIHVVSHGSSQWPFAEAPVCSWAAMTASPPWISP